MGKRNTTGGAAGVMIDLTLPIEAELAAVMAHGALNSMTVVTGTLDAMSGACGDIDDTLRDTLLASARSHAQLVTALLYDLVSGLPLGATAILRELDDESQQRRARS